MTANELLTHLSGDYALAHYCADCDGQPREEWIAVDRNGIAALLPGQRRATPIARGLVEQVRGRLVCVREVGAVKFYRAIKYYEYSVNHYSD